MLLAAALSALWTAACDRGEPHGDSIPKAPSFEQALGDLEFEASESLLKKLQALSPLPPPPADPTNRFADDPDAARFGEALFFDPRFSGNGAVSCATCHDPAKGFSDGLQLAMGQSLGNRHTPTLWNVAYHRWLTWDGRADSLWMQALDPMEDPREMGTSRGRVAVLIHGAPPLRDAFEEVFGPMPKAAWDWGTPEARAVGARPARATERDGEPPLDAVENWKALSQGEQDAIDQVFVSAGKALAAYQRTLLRAESPFDEFVAGWTERDPKKLRALSEGAQRGLILFLGKGNCTLCHNGPNFTDGEFHNNSLPTLHGGEPEDPGRYAGATIVKESRFNAAGPFSDEPNGPRAQGIRLLKENSESWGEFRTPSLRNLVDRAPYMHQGQFPSLEAVVDFYSELEGASGRSHHQEQILVPLGLSDGEKADLVAFLRSLAGRKL